MDVGTNCTAQRNAGHGFLAVDGGRMVIQQACSAVSNGCAGFTAEGSYASLEIKLGCRAYNNKQHGFYSGSKSCITIEGGADASFNKGCGFCASGFGSKIVAGSGCVATDNGGWGYLAGVDGAMHVYQDRVSHGNRCYAHLFILLFLILAAALYIAIQWVQGRRLW
jgi:hypothetical protein